MPFDLSPLTLDQCTRFVGRLATQLQPTTSRASLMAVREAFARAAGYPDAHALEAAEKSFIKRQSDSHAGIAEPHHHFSDRGVLDWARRAWKQQRALLGREPFGEDEAKALLASIWGYASWLGVVTALELKRSNQPEPWIHGNETDQAAIEMGTDEAGRRLWMSDLAWRGHTLLIDGDQSRRRHVVFDWAAQRKARGDRVVILDGGRHTQADDGKPIDFGAHAKTLDWRDGMASIPGLAHWSRGMLTEFLVAGLAYPTPGQVGPDFQGEQTPVDVITAAWAVADQFCGLGRKQRSTDTLSRLVAGEERLETFRREAWARAIGQARKNAEATSDDDIRVLLPSLMDGDLDDGQRRRIALASAWIKIELQKRADTEADGPRAAFFWLDVPLWARARGWSVVYAQAKSAGVSIVEAGSRGIMWGTANGEHVRMTDETSASVGNLNTKVFGVVDQAPNANIVHVADGRVEVKKAEDLHGLESREMKAISGAVLVGYRMR